ncbi:MAG: phage major capsid protein, partial [Sphingobium limneticum]
MNLAVLKNEAREAAKRMEDRLTAAIGENRDLTAEEDAENTKDEARLDVLEKQIAQVERLNARAAKFGPATAAIAAAVATATVPAAPAGAAPVSYQHNGLIYASARPRLDDGGFSNLAEFAGAVRFANPGAGQAYKIDDRLAAPANV